MSKHSVVLLFAAIIAFVLFFSSWIAFKTIKPIDWGILALGAADLLILLGDLKKGENQEGI